METTAIQLTLSNYTNEKCLVPQKTSSVLTVHRRKSRNVIARLEERPTSHKADAFTSREDIDNILFSLLDKKQIGKACLFIVGINTGYRCGDLLSFRVKDVQMDNGELVDMLYLSEDKTDKARVVYFNKAVKTALRFLIEQKNLTPENYLFRGDGNKRTYLDHFELDENGNVTAVKTIGQRYREDGTEREIAPMLVGSVTRFLKDEAVSCGILGHFSSHCMRKTFVEFISRGWNDDRNMIAASAAVGHSDVAITLKYYAGTDPVKLRNKWLEMNLGLDTLNLFIDEYAL